VEVNTMTYEERERVVTNERTGAPPAYPAATPSVAVAERSVDYRPSGAEVARRVVTLIFGLIIGLIVLRIILLLLDAREGNALVSGILSLSEIFVAPFNGILRTNALAAGGSILDVAAIVAIVGWAIVYLVVLAILNIARREPTAA
jgi:hypothetical protein